jgi:exodeoxyribonuclease VII small subunit
MAKPNNAEKPLTFESALAELEGIVSQMEGGDLNLEQSLSSYQRGAVLLKFCQVQLAQAHERVRVLEAGELTPFSDAQDQQ